MEIIFIICIIIIFYKSYRLNTRLSLQEKYIQDLLKLSARKNKNYKANNILSKEILKIHRDLAIVKSADETFVTMVGVSKWFLQQYMFYGNFSNSVWRTTYTYREKKHQIIIFWNNAIDHEFFYQLENINLNTLRNINKVQKYTIQKGCCFTAISSQNEVFDELPLKVEFLSAEFIHDDPMMYCLTIKMSQYEHDEKPIIGYIEASPEIDDIYILPD